MNPCLGLCNLHFHLRVSVPHHLLQLKLKIKESMNKRKNDAVCTTVMSVHLTPVLDEIIILSLFVDVRLMSFLLVLAPMRQMLRRTSSLDLQLVTMICGLRLSWRLQKWRYGFKTHLWYPPVVYYL